MSSHSLQEVFMSTKIQNRSVRRVARYDSVAAADESSVLRYNRIANLEAVLSIREQRQRNARLMTFWSVVLMVATLALAAFVEWN